jgi:hypothetical protein
MQFLFVSYSLLEPSDVNSEKRAVITTTPRVTPGSRAGCPIALSTVAASSCIWRWR